jgi:hypothetical protein
MGPSIRHSFEESRDAAKSPDELASLASALEPDQLIAAKQQHHCPRRELTRTEMVLFWALRIYLLFMFGVVIYQVWTGVR